jgi:DUF3025 family protein
MAEEVDWPAAPMSLHAQRRSQIPFDPLFYERDPLLWPLARAASTFAREADWPDVRSYARAFASDPVVRFEPPKPAPRRRRAPPDPNALYDARITHDRCVPTRPECWHDFLNALVWATFPRAKLALHGRQLQALLSRLDPGARTLPPTRSREHDALALLDEGGAVVLEDGPRRRPVLFGHALYEGLVLGVRPRAAAALAASLPQGPVDAGACLGRVDEAIASRLAGAPLMPEDLARLTLS